MELTRRNALLLGSGALVAAGVGGLPAYAAQVEEAIATLTGGAGTREGTVSLSAPAIAENGNSVPITVTAPGAEMVALFADGNPAPKVAVIRFGPLNPTREATTRIRLATTQKVIAVAKMKDGTFRKAETLVKVTLGGCGG